MPDIITTNLPLPFAAITSGTHSLIFFAMIFVGPFVGWIAYEAIKAVKQVAIHRENVDLKRQMLEDGRSVDEIERVLEAGDVLAHDDD